MNIVSKILRKRPVFVLSLGCFILYSSTTSLLSQSFGSSKSRLKPALYYHFAEEDVTKFQEIFPYIVVKSREYGVPLPLVLAVIKTESNFRPDSVSPAGALGLMQLMPSTAKAQYRKVFPADRTEELEKGLIMRPELNVTLGIRYLRQLEETLKGIENPRFRRKMVLASYNAGLRRVKESFLCGKTKTLVRWINHYGKDYMDLASHRLPRETRNYIDKVNRTHDLYIEYLNDVTTSI